MRCSAGKAARATIHTFVHLAERPVFVLERRVVEQGPCDLLARKRALCALWPRSNPKGILAYAHRLGQGFLSIAIVGQFDSTRGHFGQISASAGSRGSCRQVRDVIVTLAPCAVIRIARPAGQSSQAVCSSHRGYQLRVGKDQQMVGELSLRWRHFSWSSGQDVAPLRSRVQRSSFLVRVGLSWSRLSAAAEVLWRRQASFCRGQVSCGSRGVSLIYDLLVTGTPIP